MVIIQFLHFVKTQNFDIDDIDNELGDNIKDEDCIYINFDEHFPFNNDNNNDIEESKQKEITFKKRNYNQPV